MHTLLPTILDDSIANVASRLGSSLQVYTEAHGFRLLLSIEYSVQGALLLALWDDNKPIFGMGSLPRHQRPRLMQLPDIEDP